MNRGIIKRNLLSMPCGAPQPAAIPDRPARLGNIRAVLFDVYGTLLHCEHNGTGFAAAPTDRAIAESMSAAGLKFAPHAAPAAAARLLPALIAAEHARKKASGVLFPEIEIREIWRRALAELAAAALLKTRATAAQIERLAVEYECRANPVRPMPHVGMALDAARRRGLRLGIVSNAQFHTPLILRSLPELGPRFKNFEPELCIWSYEVGHAKPSPLLLHIALQRLTRMHNISPRQTLFVGNSIQNDVVPAAASGAKTMLFAGDAKAVDLGGCLPQRRNVKPTAVLKSFANFERFTAAP